MTEHPTLWARIKAIDPRPAWTEELRRSLRAEGFTGDIKIASNKNQLLDETLIAGPTLYLIGNVAFGETGLPVEVLDLWASKRCKVVFLHPDIGVFSSQLENRNIDFASRAIDGDGTAMSAQSIARKILQFEPKQQINQPLNTPQTGRLEPIRNGSVAPRTQSTPPPTAKRRISVIGLGASTGGVDALQVVLSELPPTLPPILIVQHSRSTGGGGLAQVLGRSTAVKVVSAENNMPLMPGHAYVATGREQHLRLGRNNKLMLQLVTAPSVSGHRPSVDVMFDSLSDLGSQVAGVLLTGMGQDGAAGLKRIRDRGGWTAAQDKASSVVYGMPKAAAECGAVIEQLSLKNVAPRLMEICQR